MEANLMGASSLNGNFQEDEMPWLDKEENQEPKESDAITSPTTQEEAEQTDFPP